MHFLQSTVFLIITLLITGCLEKTADLDSPQSYSSQHITFQYPGNWKITMNSGIGHLTLETPGDAIVILQPIQINQPGQKFDLTNQAKAFSENFIKETPIGEITVDSFTDLEDQSGYQRILEKFHMSLLGEQIAHHRLYAGKDIVSHYHLLIFQVPSEDFEKTKPGFELILKTLQPATE